MRTREDGDDAAVLALLPVVRRVLASRVRDPHLVDDLVQEVVARVMGARDRVEGDLVAYAVTTAKNLVAEGARQADRDRRHAPRLLERELEEAPALEGVLREEDRSEVGAALSHLDPAERDVLLAHELGRKSTAAIADDLGSTAGAVAAQLARTRSKLRVEYLVARERADLPTDRCRPVLRAVSAGDRRRQDALDASGHLLVCDVCAGLAAALRVLRPAADDDRVRVEVSQDADVVTARQRAREVCAGAGFTGTDLTLVATAVSELARNIVKFARRGEVIVEHVRTGDLDGVRVVARDAGPGIADLEAAVSDGFSTYAGLGLGLPGARRLMDEFEIISEPGQGTTVTITKWRAGGRR